MDPTAKSDNYLGKNLEFYPIELDKQKYTNDDGLPNLCKDESEQDPRFISAGISISDYSI